MTVLLRARLSSSFPATYVPTSGRFSQRSCVKGLISRGLRLQVCLYYLPQRGAGGQERSVHANGEGAIDILLGIINEEALVRRVPAACDGLQVDFRVRLEQFHLMRQEHLLEAGVQRQAGLLKVRPVVKHRQGVVVAEQEDVVLLPELLYQFDILRCGGAEELAVAADDLVPRGAGRAVLEAFGDEFVKADAPRLHVQEEPVLVAWVDILVDVPESGDLAVRLDHTVQVERQQHAAHVEKDGSDQGLPECDVHPADQLPYRLAGVFLAAQVGGKDDVAGLRI